MNRLFRRLFRRILALILCAVLLATAINLYVISSAQKHLFTIQEAQNSDNVQCILVLGASVRNPTTPSLVLQDRLDQAIVLYQTNCAPILLMSGDHRAEDYNEVGTMEHYAIEQGVPAAQIFLDHKGNSTFESLYRAKEVFGYERIFVVSQKYHLYRAVFIGNALGMETYGVPCDNNHRYEQQQHQNSREFLARIQDFLRIVLKIYPSYADEPISFTDNNTNNI